MTEPVNLPLTLESEIGNVDIFAAGANNSQGLPSAGRMLRQAREAAGLHIAALAVSLKVPVKKLEALESDQFDYLPDAVFVRALASSVCRTLKMDPAPVLELLPPTGKPKLVYQGSGINAPFRSPGDVAGPSMWSQVSRPALIGGAALLLGALMLVFLPELNAIVEEISTAQSTEKILVAVAEKPETQVLPAPQSMLANKTASPVVAFGSLGTDSSLTASAAAAGISSNKPDVSAPVGSSQLAPATVIPASSTSAAIAGLAAVPAIQTGIVVFSAKGESWVEVTDAKGQVVLRRTLGVGEVAGATGVLPLAAIVGRADATQVQVRGKAFDVTAFAKDNVARFEVK